MNPMPIEILRQRQIYRLLRLLRSNQIIAASHSEVLLNEAADKDLVIAFVGEPQSEMVEAKCARRWR